MNLKITLGLVVIASVIGVVVYVNPFAAEETKAPRSPWFFQVEMDDIIRIEVSFEGESVKFEKTPEGTWAFEHPADIPPSAFRWGGITLLVSGPQTRRDLTATETFINDPTEFGLDVPHTIVKVGLTGDRQIEFRIGDETADGRDHYGEVVGFDELFIIAAAWGDVLARLAKEPPLPKWYIERTPEELEQVNIYRGDPGSAETPVLTFEQDDGEWSVMYRPNDTSTLPVDSERFEEIRPLLPGPPPITIGVPLVDDSDYAPWGITDDSRAVEIRFSGVSDRGTRYIDGILLRIGSKAEGTSAYYAKSESDRVREPVLLIDADWVESMFSLHENIPYGAEPPEPASAAN